MFALLAVLAVLHLTAADNHKTFSAKPQQVIVITLPSNPSTGYRWVQEVAMDIPLHLRQVSHRYVAPTKAEPGAPGKEVWRFRAFSKGTTSLGFQYVQRWHHHRRNRQFSVTIRVS